MNARQKRTDQRAQDRDTYNNHNAARVARIKAQAIGKPCPYQEQRDKLNARPAVWTGLNDVNTQPITAEDKYQKAHALHGKLLTFAAWVIGAMVLTSCAGFAGVLYQAYFS